jgi:hypothetical protein
MNDGQSGLHTPIMLQPLDGGGHLLSAGHLMVQRCPFMLKLKQLPLSHCALSVHGEPNASFIAPPCPPPPVVALEPPAPAALAEAVEEVGEPVEVDVVVVVELPLLQAKTIAAAEKTIGTENARDAMPTSAW